MLLSTNLQQWLLMIYIRIYTQILEHLFRDVDVNNLKGRQQLASILKQIVGVIVILFNPLSAAGIQTFKYG